MFGYNYQGPFLIYDQCLPMGFLLNSLRQVAEYYILEVLRPDIHLQTGKPGNTFKYTKTKRSRRGLDSVFHTEVSGEGENSG